MEYLVTTPDYLPSMNFAVDATAFAEVGGFDAAFTQTGEDRDFQRALGREREVVSADDAVICHAHRLGARSFVEQHFRFRLGCVPGTGARSRPDRAGFASSRRRSVGLVRHSLSKNGAGSPLARALIAGAQLATAGGFAWEVAAEPRGVQAAGVGFEPGRSDAKRFSRPPLSTARAPPPGPSPTTGSAWKDGRLEARGRGGGTFIRLLPGSRHGGEGYPAVRFRRGDAMSRG